MKNEIHKANLKKKEKEAENNRLKFEFYMGRGKG